MPSFQCAKGHTYFSPDNFTFCPQCISGMLNSPEPVREKSVVRMRILPRPEMFPLAHEPRVKFLYKDDSGFTVVEAELFADENICWRCGGIAMDSDHTLSICPHCGGDFND